MNTQTATNLATVCDRIEGLSLDLNHYAIGHILEALATEDRDPATLTDSEFLRLLDDHPNTSGTNAPCPAFCQYDHGHPYELENEDGSETRYHWARLAAPAIEGADGVYLALLQEETRGRRGDDRTIVGSRPVVSFEAEGRYQSATLRQTAAALLNAADTLDEINR